MSVYEMRVGPFVAHIPCPYPQRVARDAELHELYENLLQLSDRLGRLEGRGDEVRAERVRRRAKRALRTLHQRILATGGATWGELDEIQRDLHSVRTFANLTADTPR